MRKFNLTYLVCFFLLDGLQLQAQGPVEITKTYRAATFLTRYTQLGTNFTAGDIITSMPLSYQPVEVKGDSYWDNHWGKSSLLLYKNDELIEGYATRYDILKDEFEFKLQQDVRVLGGNKVKNIVWIDSVTNKDRYLVNGREYYEDGAPLSGFVEVLVDAEVALIKHIRIEVLKPDFNPALNVGSKDTRVIKKESYYFNRAESLVRIKSKKSLDVLGPVYGQKINQFIKTNNVKLNNEADLIRLFQYLSGK